MIPQEELLTVGGNDHCGECGGMTVLDPGAEERVCCSCGIVTEATESPFPSQNALGASPVGSPGGLGTLEYDLALPSQIDNRNVGAKGSRVRDSAAMQRLRRTDSLVLAEDPAHRNNVKAAREIARITRTLGLGNAVAEKAYRIYRLGYREGVTKKRTIVSMAAAVVYISCRESGVPFSIEEVGLATGNVNARSLRRYSKIFFKVIDLRIDELSPAAYVSKIANRCDLSAKVERRAIEVLASVKDDPALAGKRPVSIAASALYLAGQSEGEPTSQLKVAFAAGVTPETLRRRTGELQAIFAQAAPAGSGDASPSEQARVGA